MISSQTPDSLNARPDSGRRRLLGGALGGAGLALSGGLLTASFQSALAQQMPPVSPALTDPDILNFALNLEYLEAEYYLQGVFGENLSGEDIRGTGNLGAVQGGRRVNFVNAGTLRERMAEIARDEVNHVQFLRSALGDQAVARPAIDFTTAFTTAGRAAGVIGPNETFDPFANENFFLLGAFLFEDVGVTAYKGAAPLITDKGLLEAAAGILAVEAYHAGSIRTELLARGLQLPAARISNARDTLDGPDDLDQGIVEPIPGNEAGNTRANIVPTDENGVAFSRTPQQILNIVYLGGEASNFGFFPNRVNGAFGA